MNLRAGFLKGQTTIINLEPDFSKRGPKQIKSQTKEERSQEIPQKYKQLSDNTMKNSMPTNWTTWKKWANSQTPTH